MSIFASPFFSKAGQKERLVNVGRTLKGALTGEKIVGLTPNATANKLLGAAASNPLITAGLGAVAAAPAAALGAASSGFGALSTTGKVATVGAGLVVVPAVIQNPQIASKAAQAPSELAKFGSDLGKLSKDPSVEGFKGLVEESPVISGAVAGGALILGGAAVRGAANIASTAANTRAIREATALAEAGNPVTALSALPTVSGPEPSAPQTQPLTPATQVLGREVSTSQPRKSPRKRVAAPRPPSVRVQVLNQNTFIGA